MVKVALLIGVGEYSNGLPALPAAPKDIEAMREVLANPEIGGFDLVTPLINPERQVMEEAIYTLFANRKKDDLLLLFFSGHGVKDDSGNLYLAVRNTRKQEEVLVQPTAVAASFVQNVMSNSRSKRQVVILDCCFSGAFAEGMRAKDDGSVPIQQELGGEGRVVLTSSTSTQYSYEQQGFDLSVYTRYLVEGIQTGAADINNDGAISVDELHDYARSKVQEASPAMKPKIYAVEEGYKIRLAQAPIGDPKLRYRKEVERYKSRGEILFVARSILDALRDSLNLLPEEATKIEAEVLKPYQEYQEKLQHYQQVLSEALRQENTLTTNTRNDLKRLQKVLGLREEDVAPIEEQVARQLPRLFLRIPHTNNYRLLITASIAAIFSLIAGYPYVKKLLFTQFSPLVVATPNPTTSPPAVATINSKPNKPLEGVDIAEFSGNIDWQQVKNHGISFALARANDGINHKDSLFPAYWPAIKKAGIIRGAYFLFRPTQDIDIQVRSFVQVVDLKPGDLPPFIDILSSSSWDSLSLMERIDRVAKCLKAVENATGYKPIIFTEAKFWREKMGNTSRFSNYPLWIKNHSTDTPSIPGGWKSYTFHQYIGDQTGFPGIQGDVDRNRFDGSLDDLQKFVIPIKK